MEYIAIKVRGLEVWLWFKKENIISGNGVFIGKGGWGRGGELTSIKVNEDQIIGTIESSALQYT